VGLSLEGAVIKADPDDNRRLYGRPVTARQLLIEGTLPAPAAARGLDETLARYSPHGGQPFGQA